MTHAAILIEIADNHRLSTARNLLITVLLLLLIGWLSPYTRGHTSSIHRDAVVLLEASCLGAGRPE